MQIHEKLLETLQNHAAPYRVCTHIAEGRSREIAAIRGNDPHQALKAIVVMAKISKKEKKFYLAIIPGDRMLDLEALAIFCNAKKAIFAPLDTAREYTGCEIGAIPPFSFSPELALIADPQIKDNEDVVFNAGLLTKSIFMSSADYVRIAAPAFAAIAK